MVKRYHVKFTSRNLTGNAGLVHLGRFAEKLQLSKIIERAVTIERGKTTEYKVSEAVMMMIMGVLGGAKHISHLAIMRTDSVMRQLFKWVKYPEDRTFGRIFRLFSQKHCNELHEAESEARGKVWSRKWYERITLDMDSTVIGVTGSQEGTAKGYNAKKKGQKSYHPLLCFIAETRECLHNWFRTGSAYTGNGASEFMKECLMKLPKKVKQVFVRADSGFFNGELLEVLEENKSEYLIKVKMKKLGELLMGQEWKKVKWDEGRETTEFWYKCGGWKKERRFVAVRKEVEGKRKDTLFPMPQYELFCYVTNMDITPLRAHQCYGQRSTSENWIEWCKNHMASGSIRTQDFWANAAIFQTSILAYNLMVWMMWLNTKESFHEEPNTIRAWLIRVPGKLITRSRQWVLNLSEDYYFKKRWIELENSIEALTFA